MDAEARAELKKKIVEEIEVQKHLIESFTLTSKPVAPDNAIGRLTRMEAISSQGISEASLNSAQVKLVKLEKALSKVDLPDFGICVRCSIRFQKAVSCLCRKMCCAFPVRKKIKGISENCLRP